MPVSARPPPLSRARAIKGVRRVSTANGLDGPEAGTVIDPHPPCEHIQKPNTFGRIRAHPKGPEAGTVRVP